MRARVLAGSLGMASAHALPPGEYDAYLGMLCGSEMSLSSQAEEVMIQTWCASQDDRRLRQGLWLILGHDL